MPAGGRTIAFTALVGAVPADTAAQQTCRAADRHRMVGSLDRAKKLYESVKVADAEQSCAVEGLALVADARRKAAKFVTARQLAPSHGPARSARLASRSAHRATPARLTTLNFLAHFSRSRCPAAVAGNSSVASTFPITAWRPQGSGRQNPAYGPTRPSLRP
ncbi:hypothetical protein [Streptomyces sp. NPDC021622]|uniref:hypothetical protein n=1 Tax=Streptomyces sp. NPDC021622 TaxID=3155013 RepID=UPI0033CFC076